MTVVAAPPLRNIWPFNSLFEMPLVVSEGLPHYERDDLSILYLRCAPAASAPPAAPNLPVLSILYLRCHCPLRSAGAFGKRESFQFSI